MWVDDSFPGYLETLNDYAETKHDLNPNRNRDNLDILKYSLRSLDKNIPWLRNIYLLTMRPQVPPWLNVDHPRIKVVHHDSVFEPEQLPTFNSFAIESRMHLVEGLSEAFVFVNDDFFIGKPVRREDLIGDDGKDLMYFEARYAPKVALRDSDKVSPWDAGRAHTNHLLNQAFGKRRRLDVGHVPTVIRRSAWAEMFERWNEDYERLGQCRFREKYNVVPEFMYPHYMINTGRAHAMSFWQCRRNTHYHGAENSWPLAVLGTTILRLRRPKFFVINDNFEHNPKPRVVRRWRHFLESMFPEKSQFER